MSEKSRTIFAPAKLNLFLHVTGRRENGFHTLDSLVTFANIGDTITIEDAPSFSLHTNGPFPGSLPQNHDDNLVVQTAKTLSKHLNKPLNVKITLTKNLPLAAGIGGGSSDAAATIRGLIEHWKIKNETDHILKTIAKLGADIPVCFQAKPTIMRGIGDILLPAPAMPKTPIVLINPMIPCPTKDVFAAYEGHDKHNTALPAQCNTIDDLVKILDPLDNDLLDPALKIVPDIQNVINALNTQKECHLARMSGSGATCFGLFETIEHAERTAKTIKSENPNWWIKTGHIST